MMSPHVLVIKNNGYTSNNLLDYSALIISDLAHYCLTGEIHLFLTRKQNTTDKPGGDGSSNTSSLQHFLEHSTVQTCTAIASSSA